MSTLLTLALLALLSDTQISKNAPAATNSGPIAITSDDRFVWVVNRDNNSVSVIKVEGDVNKKIAEIPVGKEPRCVAITPDDKKVFVTNMVDGTVSVIEAEEAAKPWCRAKTIRVGTEPFGCAVTPDGRKLYVANFGSDDVSVISTKFERVIKTIKKGVGPKPRGIAIIRASRVATSKILKTLMTLTTCSILCAALARPRCTSLIFWPSSAMMGVR